MGRNLEVLLLTSDEVRELLTMRDAIEAVEEAFREKGLGLVDMPPKLYLFFPKYDGDLRVMPAYMKKSDIAGVKIVNVHAKNPKEHGLPTVMAVIELVDPATGAPLALMDGTLITAFRTGAAGGVAAKYLARPDSRVIGVVGAGVQGRFQLRALAEILRDVELVKVYDARRSAAECYVEEMSEELGLNIMACPTVEETVKGIDVLVTATPSRQPIVMAEWVDYGLHINAIGADAPGKEELDPEILKRAKIVVDDVEQASHSGEINVPLSKGILRLEDIYGELGEVVAGKKPGRETGDEITVFDSTGLAIQDVSVAWLVYRKAKERGVGTWVKLL